MKVLVLITFGFLSIGVLGDEPYLKKLTPEQIERLRNWTEDDKQNVWELSGQTEGDMVLDPEQRNGLIAERYRWSNNEIPYELDPIFNEEEVAHIKKSLEEYDEKTCLKVRPRNEDDKDYVYVTGQDSGCWSSVGRRGGRQTLNLQRYPPGTGCFREGTIVHEFLHAAGFYHMQSATERDDYVEIVWDNIESGKENNFVKHGADVITSFGQDYDFESVLHYGAYAFSKNGERTIIPLVDGVEIGQRYGMSEIDVIKVKKMYGCAK